MNEITPSLDPDPKWIRITARIWSAPIILYTLLMAAGYTWNWLSTGVADPYAVEGTSFVEALPPILMFISVLGLALAWRWEKFGGVFSLVFTAGVIIVLLIQRPLSDELSRILIPYSMSLIILIPGILFLIYGIRSGKNPQ